MNRRSFLKLGAVAAPAVVAGRVFDARLPAATVTLDPITSISIDEYLTSADHRVLADDLMQQAGLTADVVRYIEHVDGRWHFDVYATNAAGRFYVNDDGVVSMRRVVLR